MYTCYWLKQLNFICGLYKNLYYRLNQHNSGRGAKFTRGRKWKLIYKQAYSSKSDAIKNEYKLKKDIKLRNKIKLKYIKK